MSDKRLGTAGGLIGSEDRTLRASSSGPSSHYVPQHLEPYPHTRLIRAAGICSPGQDHHAVVPVLQLVDRGDRAVVDGVRRHRDRLQNHRCGRQRGQNQRQDGEPSTLRHAPPCPLAQVYRPPVAKV